MKLNMSNNNINNDSMSIVGVENLKSFLPQLF